MIAIEGAFATNFLRGVAATINPCGFALLPTYLMFFLGLEGARPGTQRASVLRALKVSGAVASGFLAVFLALGILFRAGFTWFLDQAGWLSIAVGVLLTVLGIAMLFGYRPMLRLPKFQKGGTDGTVASMFLYGVSYAVASIGCALGLFTPALLSFSQHGVVSGVLTIATYGVGMAFTLTALTVSLALARRGLLDLLRSAMRYLDVVAAIFLIVTGLYLVIYGRFSLTLKSNGAVSQVESWQQRLQSWVSGFGVWTLAIVLGGITVAATLFVALRRDHRPVSEQ